MTARALTVGNDRHVPNILRVVHETTDLAARLVSILPMMTDPMGGTGDVYARRTSSTVKLVDC